MKEDSKDWTNAGTRMPARALHPPRALRFRCYAHSQRGAPKERKKEGPDGWRRTTPLQKNKIRLPLVSPLTQEHECGRYRPRRERCLGLCTRLLCYGVEEAQKRKYRARNRTIHNKPSTIPARSSLLSPKSMMTNSLPFFLRRTKFAGLTSR